MWKRGEVARDIESDAIAALRLHFIALCCCQRHIESTGVLLSFSDAHLDLAFLAHAATMSRLGVAPLHCARRLFGHNRQALGYLRRHKMFSRVKFMLGLMIAQVFGYFDQFVLSVGSRGLRRISSLRRRVHVDRIRSDRARGWSRGGVLTAPPLVSLDLAPTRPQNGDC